MNSNSFPFCAQIAVRRDKFCKLYSSLILHREISSYFSMITEIEKSSVTEGDVVDIEGLNRAISVIEKYNYKSIKHMIDSVMWSIKTSFSEEQFHFFRGKMPQFDYMIQGHLFSKDEIKGVEKMLTSRLQGFSEVCKDLERLDGDIQDTLMQIYSIGSAAVTAEGLAAQKKGVASVGAGMFAFNGLALGSSMKPSTQLKLVNSCMRHVAHYLHRIEAFHKLVMSSMTSLNSLFEKVSDQYAQRELELYEEMMYAVNNQSIVDGIFEEYFNAEISEIDETLELAVYGDDQQFTFADMVNFVHQEVEHFNIENKKAA